MSQVFQSFTSQLSDQIKHTDIRSERGKNRLARDAAYFTRRLKALHYVDPPSNSVIEAVDNVVIIEPETTGSPVIDKNSTSDQK